MKKILETKRTYLREFLPNDARWFYELNLDPEVVKYTGDPPFESVEQASEFIDNYNQYKVNGYGRWAVCLKQTHEFIGFCGLKYHPEEDITEVGFRFFRRLWGQGFATETAKACLELGFKNLKLKEIYAHADRENAGSIRVLEKCGLKFVEPIVYDGQEANLYCISLEEYEQN